MDTHDVIGHVYHDTQGVVIFDNNPPNKKFTKERDRASIMVIDVEGNIGFGKFTTKTQDLVVAGGGVEEGESLEEALVREAHEELGCAIKNIKPLGSLSQYAQWGEHFERQNYHCFVADIDGDKYEPEFTEREIQVGLSVVWISLQEAQDLFANQREHIQTLTGRIFIKKLKEHLVQIS